MPASLRALGLWDSCRVLLVFEEHGLRHLCGANKSTWQATRKAAASSSSSRAVIVPLPLLDGDRLNPGWVCGRVVQDIVRER